MQQEETDLYVIPPNFIESGTIFGGTIKLRNALEALAIALIIVIPEFSLPVTLTTKIIIVCLTVLPLMLFAIIGINGESLSSFIINFFIYLKKRRIVGIVKEEEAEPESDTKNGTVKSIFPKKTLPFPKKRK